MAVNGTTGVKLSHKVEEGGKVLGLVEGKVIDWKGKDVHV